MNFNMYAPTRVLFGAGELGNLHQQDMPGKKAMVVISSGTSTRKYGYLDRLEEQLRQRISISYYLTRWSPIR